MSGSDPVKYIEMEVSPLRALTQCLKHFFDKCFFGTLPVSDPMKYNSYGGYSASVGIAGELLAGSLPQKQYRMLVGWLALHEEAYAAWNKAVRGEHFDKIELSQERAFTKYC